MPLNNYFGVSVTKLRIYSKFIWRSSYSFYFNIYSAIVKMAFHPDTKKKSQSSKILLLNVDSSCIDCREFVKIVMNHGDE